MNNSYMIIKMTDDEIRENPFISADGKAAFYSFISGKIGVEYENTKSIDCRMVNVAKNIQDSWFTYAGENGIGKSDMCMLLLMSGPKALETIEDNCVEIEEGAIEW